MKSDNKSQFKKLSVRIDKKKTAIERRAKAKLCYYEVEGDMDDGFEYDLFEANDRNEKKASSRILELT